MIKVDRIYIASDHAGFDLKTQVIQYLQKMDFKTIDKGPLDDGRVDYPDYADQVCKELLNQPETHFGVLICGSGQGMAMRANKFSGIRAALCWTPESAKLARQHNQANVLCLGARLLEKDNIFNILNAFFDEEFEGGRHQVRVDKISQSTLS